MTQVLQIETDTLMPPLGVADAILAITEVSHTDVFQFWLRTHTEALGPMFWRTAVLRECLPNPDGALTFVPLSPIIREQPRTALVRVAIGVSQ